MKPLQIALLVVAGALGGAVVMRVTQRSQPGPEPAPVVAQTQPAAPAAVQSPTPDPVAAAPVAVAPVAAAPVAAPAVESPPPVLPSRRVANVPVRRVPPPSKPS